MLMFIAQVILISLTGVIAPGPITAVTVGSGTQSPHSGVLIALGHGIVEFPLMALIYYGLGDVLNMALVKSLIFTLGGGFLIFMGVDMVNSARKTTVIESSGSQKPLAAGIVLSIGNAYFLIWWATVGASLITKAVSFGLAGAMTFAAVHWSCDLVWLYFLSAASYKGGRVFGLVFQKSVFAICGSFLIFFGAAFLIDVLRGFIG